MFEENTNPVIEDITENVEETTEELTDGANTIEQEQVVEQPKTYTDEEVNEIVKNRLSRQERKLRKEYDRKYGDLENVLKVGTGEDDLGKITDAFTDYYEKKGKKLPEKPQYSQDYIEYMANKEADEIINAGYDEIKEEVDRLTELGTDNMSAEDKIIFSKLAKERGRIEDERELASIGVTKIDDDFKEFASKFNPNLSMKEKYEMYVKLNPKKEVKTIGSMKSGQMNKVKDYYTEDEIAKMSLDDLDDPQVWEAVRKSMTGQN